MKILKTGSSRILLLAFIAGALGFWQLSNQLHTFSTSTFVFYSAYAASIEALFFIALIGFELFDCLNRIEKRLTTLEQNQQDINN